MTVQLEYINHLLLLLLLLSILSKDTGSTKGKPVRGVIIFQKYFLLCWHYA